MSPIIEKFVVVRLEKADLKALRWVMLARSKDMDHMSICGVGVKEREFAATNGFQVHIARPKGENPLPVGNWLVRSIAGSLVILEPIRLEFAKYEAVCTVRPMGTFASRSYLARIAVDPQRLKDVLSFKAQKAIITAGLGPVIVEMEDMDGGYELMAALMPMSIGGGKGVELVPTLEPAAEAA